MRHNAHTRETIAHLYRLAAGHGHHWAAVMSEAEAVAAAEQGGIETIRALCHERTDDSEHPAGYIDGPPALGQYHITATGRVAWYWTQHGVRLEIRRPLPDGLTGHVVVMQGNLYDITPHRQHDAVTGHQTPEWAAVGTRHRETADALLAMIDRYTLADTSLIPDDLGGW